MPFYPKLTHNEFVGQNHFRNNPENHIMKIVFIGENAAELRKYQTALENRVQLETFTNPAAALELLRKENTPPAESAFMDPIQPTKTSVIVLCGIQQQGTDAFQLVNEIAKTYERNWMYIFLVADGDEDVLIYQNPQLERVNILNVFPVGIEADILYQNIEDRVWKRKSSDRGNWFKEEPSRWPL